MRYKKLGLLAIVSILSMIFCMLLCSCDNSSETAIIKYYKDGKVCESVMKEGDTLPVQEGKDGCEFLGYVGSLEDSHNDYSLHTYYTSYYNDAIELKIDSKGNNIDYDWCRIEEDQQNMPLCPIWVKEKRNVEVVTYDIGYDGIRTEQRSDFIVLFL